MDDIFRAEALAARANSGLGEMVLLRPLSFRTYAGFGAAVVVGLAALCCFTPYTRTVALQGQMQLLGGVARLRAPTAGVVAASHVIDGQAVAEGQLMLEIISNRNTTPNENVNAEIVHQLDAKLSSLAAERARTEIFHDDEQKRLAIEIDSLGQEMSAVRDELEALKAQLRIVEQSVKSNEELAREGFVSELAVDQRRGDVEQQRAKIAALTRAGIGLAREIAARRADLKSQSFRRLQDVEQLSKASADASAQRTEQLARYRTAITAAKAGLVTSLLVQPGQVVSEGMPLATVVPVSKTFFATLYAPTRALGLVRAGMPVRLRLMPSAQDSLAQIDGVVTAISQTSLSADDVEQLTHGMSRKLTDAEGPYFSIRVRIDEIGLARLRAEAAQLLDGMTLEAHVAVERKTLFRWIVDPVRRGVNTLQTGG